MTTAPLARERDRERERESEKGEGERERNNKMEIIITKRSYNYIRISKIKKVLFTRERWLQTGLDRLQ